MWTRLSPKAQAEVFRVEDEEWAKTIADFTMGKLLSKAIDFWSPCRLFGYQSPSPHFAKMSHLIRYMLYVASLIFRYPGNPPVEDWTSKPICESFGAPRFKELRAMPKSQASSRLQRLSGAIRRNFSSRLKDLDNQADREKQRQADSRS